MSEAIDSLITASSPAAPSIAPSSTPKWVIAIATLDALLLALGAVISLAGPQLLVAPTAPVDAATRVFAAYVFSRNAALALALCFTLFRPFRHALPWMLAIVATINFLDAMLDIVGHRYPVIPAALTLAILSALASARAARSR